MNIKIKWLIFGLITCLTLSVVSAVAISGTVQKELEYNNIKIFVDGNPAILQDAAGNYVEPFIIDGTTYLPVRAIAQALGKEVLWDDYTKTVYIGAQPQQAYMNAFKENIEYTINTYGGFDDRDGIGVFGTKYGTLIDFEKDAVPELVLLHDRVIQVYRFDGQKSTLIYEKKAGERVNQTDVSHTFRINLTGDKPTLITYNSDAWYDEGRDYEKMELINVFTVINGEANVTKLMANGAPPEDFPALKDFANFEIDGQKVTYDEYEAVKQSYMAGGKEVDACWNHAWAKPGDGIDVAANYNEFVDFLKGFGL